MHHCQQCAHALAQDARFCPQCGHPVPKVEPSQPPEDAAANQNADISATSGNSAATETDTSGDTAANSSTSTGGDVPPAGRRSPQAAPIHTDMPGGYRQVRPPQIPFNWLAPNIVLLIVCCATALPVSIIGIVFGALVSSAYQRGDYEQAKSNARIGKICFFIALGLGLLLLLVTAIFGVTGMTNIMREIMQSGDPYAFLPNDPSAFFPYQ